LYQKAAQAYMMDCYLLCTRCAKRITTNRHPEGVL
jgi:hypothetical protein